MMSGAAALVVMFAAYLGGGCLALLAPSSRSARGASAIGAAMGCVAALGVAVRVLVTARPAELALPTVLAGAGGLLLHVDPLGAFFLAVVAIGGLPAAIYGVSYTAAYEGRGSLGAFGLLFNVFLLGMSGVACAGNVLTFLIAWELMSIASYFLVMTEAEEVETRQAGLWYIAMTQFSLVTLLPMFLLLAPGADLWRSPTCAPARPRSGRSCAASCSCWPSSASDRRRASCPCTSGCRAPTRRRRATCRR